MAVHEDGIPVKLPSGATFLVLTDEEAKALKAKVAQYNKQFKLGNVSDLADLDKIACMEIYAERLARYISLGTDYFGDPVANEPQLSDRYNKISAELRLLKKALRMDRDSRSQDDNVDTMSYIESLRQRAKAFGLMRDEQLAKGVELCHQLLALHQLYLNCNEQERKEMRCTPQDLVDWIGSEFKKEFEAVDKRFREDNQRLWFLASSEGL